MGAEQWVIMAFAPHWQQTLVNLGPFESEAAALGALVEHGGSLIRSGYEVVAQDGDIWVRGLGASLGSCSSPDVLLSVRPMTEGTGGRAVSPSREPATVGASPGAPVPPRGRYPGFRIDLYGGSTFHVFAAGPSLRVVVMDAINQWQVSCKGEPEVFVLSEGFRELLRIEAQQRADSVVLAVLDAYGRTTRGGSDVGDLDI
jgi:hypothetical protein